MRIKIEKFLYKKSNKKSNKFWQRHWNFGEIYKKVLKKFRKFDEDLSKLENISRKHEKILRSSKQFNEVFYNT